MVGFENDTSYGFTKTNETVTNMNAVIKKLPATLYSAMF